MNENFLKLKEQIKEIDILKNAEQWGPEYQLWIKKTETIIRDLFGEEYLQLFKQQATVTVSYIDEDYNIRQYQKELDNRKKILEGLIVDVKEQVDNPTSESQEKNILKKIWNNERALKENLLTTPEAQSLQKDLIKHLEEKIPSTSYAGLKLRKIKIERKFQTWWSNSNGYPLGDPWKMIQPFLEILEQFEAEKTIKNRLETEGLFVESRSQGEDQHILIGEKDGTGEKAHIIIDGKNGEIRIEDKRRSPEELVAKIETIFTLPNGKKIRTSRELLEEI